MLQDMKTRVGGLALIAVGAALGWYFVLGPLDEARRGVPEISYSLKIFLIVPLCLIFGAAFLVMGSRLSYRDQERKTLTLTGWILFALIALATAAGFWWFKEQFSTLGYM